MVNELSIHGVMAEFELRLLVCCLLYENKIKVSDSSCPHVSQEDGFFFIIVCGILG